MRSSTAFEAIRDPDDPAWHGHADVRRAGRWWRLRPRHGAVLLAAAVVGAFLLVTTLLRDPDRPDPPAVRASAMGGPMTPVPVLRATAPAAPQAPADGTTRTQSAAGSGPRTRTPTTAAAASGWAPAAATVPAWLSGSGMVTGDLAGVNPELIRRLDAVAVALGRNVRVISGWRTRHEQEDLYRRFQRGTGNLAAVPGTSNHETGQAADAYVDGVALADVPGARAHARAAGLGFPVPGESWHVEFDR